MSRERSGRSQISVFTSLPRQVSAWAGMAELCPRPQVWPSRADASLIPAGMSSHSKNFPCSKECPAFPALLCTARARRTSDPSFPPYCFGLFTGARNSSELTIPPGPDSHSPLVAGFPPGCHVPRGAMGKEEAPLGSEPAFQQCGRTGPRSLGGRGTLGFAPLLERRNQEQKPLVFHAAV